MNKYVILKGFAGVWASTDGVKARTARERIDRNCMVGVVGLNKDGSEASIRSCDEIWKNAVTKLSR